MSTKILKRFIANFHQLADTGAPIAALRLGTSIRPMLQRLGGLGGAW